MIVSRRRLALQTTVVDGGHAAVMDCAQCCYCLLVHPFDSCELRIVNDHYLSFLQFCLLETLWNTSPVQTYRSTASCSSF